MPLVCVTGWEWRPTIELLPKDMHAQWGIPSKDCTGAQREMWEQLDRRADVEILQQLPRLARGPKRDFGRKHLQMYRSGGGSDGEEPVEEYTPWRLWMAMVPPGTVEGTDRSLIFLGFFITLQEALRAETSSLWAFAWLNGLLGKPVMRLSVDSNAASVPSTESVNGSTNGVDHDGDIYYENSALQSFRPVEISIWVWCQTS